MIYLRQFSGVGLAVGCTTIDGEVHVNSPLMSV